MSAPNVLAIGDRVWWPHTATTVRYGTVAVVDEDRPGVLPDDDPDLVYLDPGQPQLFADLPDGQYGWISEGDYHADRKRLSSTGARLLLPPSVPARFRWVQDHPQPPKRAYDIGHVAHREILGKGAEITVLDPDVHGLTKDGKPAANPRATAGWKEAEADARRRGTVPIHADDYMAAQRMAAEVFAHPDAGWILADGAAEMSLYATGPFGVPMRARPDSMSYPDGNRLWMADVKTSTTADPAEFARKAADFGYHIQAAFYRCVAQLLGLDTDPAFVFIVVEKEPPHLVSVVEWDAEAMAEGDRLVGQALATYARCVETGEWPGYLPGIQPIRLPAWAIHRETLADLLEGN
ncbi:hypothetical protein AWC11_23165 [Mycobacterium interjectum]|nr:hypothetical protein AWC11_23165 [Mycobacterium interjectum]